MVISFNSGKMSGSGGGGKLQQKYVTSTTNGLDVVIPDSGYDGISTVYVKTYVTDASGEKDFTQLGYSVDENVELNTKMDEDIAYSKSLMPYTLNSSTFSGNKQLVYAPMPQEFNSHSSSIAYAFDGCIRLQYVPLFDLPSNIRTINALFKNCYSLKEIPLLNTENIEAMYETFSNCVSLYEVKELNTSKVTNFQSAFYNCINLVSIPKLDLSKATTLKQAFYYCYKLTTPPNLNFESLQIGEGIFQDCISLSEPMVISDMPNVTTLSKCFSSCRSITSIKIGDVPNCTTLTNLCESCDNLEHFEIGDTSKVTTMNTMFNGCKKLKSIGAIDCSAINYTNFYPLTHYTEYNDLTDVGGFLNMKYSWTNDALKKCPNLNYESCINILNGLYDFTGNNVTPTSSQGNLKVHANFLSLVGDEIAIATNKGWTITT